MANIIKVKEIAAHINGYEEFGLEEGKLITEYEVRYESGAIRYYLPDKLPKTVQTWMDKHREPEQEPEPQPGEPEQTTALAAIEPVREAVQEPELPVPVIVSELPVVTHLPLRKPTPEWQVGLFRAAGAIQLTILFLAGVGIYMAWWMVQVLSLIEGCVRWIYQRARAGMVMIRTTWTAFEPVIADAVGAVKVWAVDAAGFRADLLLENGTIGRI